MGFDVVKVPRWKMAMQAEPHPAIDQVQREVTLSHSKRFGVCRVLLHNVGTTKISVSMLAVSPQYRTGIHSAIWIPCVVGNSENVNRVH